MEEELGVKLMARSRHGIRFTPEGEVVLRHCASAADHMNAMRRMLDALRGDVGGTVNAAVCFGYAQYCLTDVLAAYTDRYPQVQIQVSTGYSPRVFQMLTEGTADVAVVRGVFPWSGRRVLLRRERYGVLCSRKYAGVPLSHYPYIDRIEAPGDMQTLAQKRRWLREQGLDPRKMVCAVDSVPLVAELVRKGVGWSIIPDVGIQDPELMIEHCRFADGERFGRDTYAMCSEEAMEMPQVRAFRDMLRQHSSGGIE